MSEKDTPGDETQPVRPAGETAPDAPAATPAPEAEATREAGPAAAASTAAATGPGWGRFRRWRNQSRGDRTFSLGALIASALAGLIVGGLGTAVVHAVTDDHDRGGWVERRGPMMGRDDRGGDDRGPMFGGPRGVPGQVQPTTPPEDDEGGSSS
ncbi:hypothetical protein J2X46_001318 [Nocardioides sp. BE266]|uniref:hypothetical protein n=1 Tax=Nocardioides sp. BE266 TaxID=2817725 RepID=UPI00286771A7|nr:hypothetical protein [Nocardioides sp. BE266]MDR7252342.1 hypothetical protein [Nocardioides sp. BE266]